MAAPKRPDHNAEPLSWTHDINDPAVVTTELTKPFPREALEVKQGFTYVKYPDMIRRLIRATGNRFSVRLVGQESTPFGKTSKGQEQVLLRAWVELEIPVLGSARTHEGVQIAYVGTGEDMFKGAISDAIKKAAQSFGVGIELTGADAEWQITQRETPAEPSPAPPPPIDAEWERLNKKAHAIVSHESLHRWAKSHDYDSYRDVPKEMLGTLVGRINNQAQAQAFMQQFDPEASHG